MQIHQAAVAARDRCNDVVHATMVATCNPRIDAQKISRIISERRVVHIAKKHGSYRQLAHKLLQCVLESVRLRARIRGQP